MRILTIIGAILMILAGALCFISPGQTFLALAFVVGMVMVINGAIQTLSYLTGRGLNNKGDNNGWILVDALITLLLGILVLCNQLVAEAAIPMVFGMWVLVTGILRIEAATRINKEKKRTNYRTAMVTGIVTTLIGLFGFINPLVTILTTVFLLGFFLVMQGINALELGINMPHEKKSYIRIYKRKREAVKITEEEETPEKVAERLKSKEEAEAIQE